MLKFFIFILLFITLCIASFSTAVLAQTQDKPASLSFDLGENNGWAPYRTGKTQEQAGILAELTILLQLYTDIEFEAVNWPAKRSEFALKNGIVDFDFICTSWFGEGNYGSQFVISEPLFEIREYVVTLKHNKQLFPNLDSIHAQAIGTIAGYFYFDDNEFIRADFRDENNLMQALKYHRVKAVILEHETAKHWAKVHDIEIALATPHTRGKLLIRLNKAKKSLMPAINLAIKKIKQTGQLQMLLDKYGVEAKIF
tara:strand:+ start:615 stop:1379 length:765 start_codon:yes stop_codon:yes gene_type:complete